MSRTQRQTVFLQRLARARDRLLNAIAGLSPEELSREHVVEDWTVKDIFGHIVSWNQEFRADIHLILRGQHPGYERQISREDDFSQSNQHWHAQKRDWTWQRIRADFDRDYEAATELILSLAPQDFRKRGVTPWKRAAWEKPAELTTADTESIETLLTYHWRHMNEHAGMIERWRKQRARKHKG